MIVMIIISILLIIIIMIITTTMEALRGECDRRGLDAAERFSQEQAVFKEEVLRQCSSFSLAGQD